MCKSKGVIDPRLESENKTLGFRISSNSFFFEVCKQFKKPITATKATSSGKKTPYSVDDILSGLSEKQKSMVSVIFDSGELPKNPPSTVVDTSADDLILHRSGGLDPNWYLLSVFRSSSTQNTIKLGKKVANDLIRKKNYNVILLSGDLGAGKTHFTKGIAECLGIEEVVKSPTYNYYNEFKFEDQKKLIHLDAWRIQSRRQIELLGITDWFKNLNNKIVIEWPDVLLSLKQDLFVDQRFLYITFTNTGFESRLIKIYTNAK